MHGLLVALMTGLFLLLAACGQLNQSPKASDTQPLPDPKVQALSIEDGLVGYWPFDADNPTADLSGNGNIATLASGLQLTTEVAPTAFANTRALLSTPIPNNYATASGKGIDTLTNYTIAFWLRVNSAATGTGNVLALGNRLVISDRILQNQQQVISVRFPLRVYPYPAEAFIPSTGWNHVIVAIRGNETNIYINGQRVMNETYLAGSSGAPTGGIYFSSPNAPLNGILDDVRIYDRTLTNIEIASLVRNCNNVQGIPSSECQALVALANSTHAEGWVNSSQWLVNNTPCNWFGVLCANGHVIALNLPNNNLSGNIPPELSNLSQLIVLALQNNHLNGSIPFELGQLSSLQTLDLFGNQLSGQIPFTLGNLGRLTTLRLYNNQLRSPIPPQLAKLNSLTTLDLGFNMLSALDSNLLNFLNTRQPNWNTTQTVPPTNLQAKAASASSITVSWTPAPYTEDGGYYDVLYMPQNGGIFKSAGHTADKKATSFMVTGLTLGQSYSFVVRTFTSKHGLQQNDLLSDSTDPVSTVSAVNHPPVAVNDSYTTTVDKSLTVDAAHGIFANDSDPDRNPLKLASINTSTPGSKFDLRPDGSFTFTPPAGFAGTVVYTYQITDGTLLSNPATVSFLVTAPPTTLTIVLDAQPRSDTAFSFGGTFGSFSLSSNNNRKTFPLSAGRLFITGQVPSGWVTANISCNPPAGTIADLTQNRLDINSSGGTSFICAFVMQKMGSVSARVYRDSNGNGIRDNNEASLAGWSFTLQSLLTPQTRTQTSNQDGKADFGNVAPGNYKVCEVPQNGWLVTQPTTNPPCYNLNVAPDSSTRLWFGNKTP